MARNFIGSVREIPPGHSKIVRLDGRDVGVFNVQGRFYALRSLCPHQGAPLCRGETVGTNLPSKPGEYCWARQGEILRCPWHGWEFDILTGRSLFDARVRVKTFPVEIEDEDVLVVT